MAFFDATVSLLGIDHFACHAAIGDKILAAINGAMIDRLLLAWLLSIADFDPAGADGVDPNVGAEANRQRVSQGDDASFAGSVRFGIRL